MVLFRYRAPGPLPRHSERSLRSEESLLASLPLRPLPLCVIFFLLFSVLSVLRPL